MEDNSSFNFVDIDDSNQLLQYRESIQDLFLDAFGKPLSKKLWNWAYQENPFGSPKVSMAFLENKLVGHYAVIPMNLSSEDKHIKGYLSMTTMVSTECRGKQLFRSLAERVYDRVANDKEPAIVFGFPNDQSAPGFIKRLGWTVSEDFHVIALEQPDFPKAQELLEVSMQGSYRLDLSGDQVSQWRCNKPTQEWSIENEIGLKAHIDGHDLMYIDNAELLEGLDLNTTLHAIMPVSIEQANYLDWTISFPYRFGYRVFNSETEPKFGVQMCMSDVF
ncbi:GNAT family N-acetyltransferase [Psychrobacter namhaensis]|uniref:GNAT family N-acetyltransferase n=1 Tax=Psychrobacter namhaensis TaxID=292734 RepID=UPI003D0449FC